MLRDSAMERPGSAGSSGEGTPNSPRRRPEGSDSSELDDSEEIDCMLTRVNRFIKRAYRANGGRPLSYFHVVLDPESYTRSVAHTYYVSFLAKGDLITIEYDEEQGLPTVRPVMEMGEEGVLGVAEGTSDAGDAGVEGGADAGDAGGSSGARRAERAPCLRTAEDFSGENPFNIKMDLIRFEELIRVLNIKEAMMVLNWV